MNDRSEETKAEPKNEAAEGSQPSASAPQNKVTKSGRLPLFRK
jgi:hypothetical protein